jgi:hypothetical protein
MARCSCAGSSCNCTFQAGSGLAVTGTGNASDPFLVTLNLQSYERIHDDVGPIDIGFAHPGAVVVLALTEDVDSIALPATPGDYATILIRQDGTGNTVTWPAEVKWPGGTPPVLSTTPGNLDWIEIRRVGDFWIGRLVASEVG